MLALALLATPVAAGRAQTFGWDKARDATSRRHREVIDLSGLAEIGFQIPASLNPEDLEAVCQTRRQGMVSAGEQAQASLRRLGDWSDPVTDAERARLHRALASVAAFSGDIDTAVRNLEAARQALALHVESYPDLLPSFMGLQEALGVAYMRQAEVQNCLVNPGADRCLFPLRPGGIHHRTAGAEAARGLFEAFLARAPADLEVRWLLNLANMVLGRYPGDVPKAHLLPPSVFRSEARLPRFVDVAPQAGLGRRDARPVGPSPTTWTATGSSTSRCRVSARARPCASTATVATAPSRTAAQTRRPWTSWAASTSCRPTTTTTVGSTCS